MNDWILDDVWWPGWWPFASWPFTSEWTEIILFDTSLNQTIEEDVSANTVLQNDTDLFQTFTDDVELNTVFSEEVEL